MTASLARRRAIEPRDPAPARLIENLPVVMRGLCDDVLSGEADAYHTAYAIASLIEVIEHVRDMPPDEPPPHHAH